MIPRYFNGLSRFEVALVAVVVCLAVVGIGRAVWPDSDGDGSAAPSTTATAKKLPVVVSSAEPALIGTDSETFGNGPAADVRL